MFAITIWAIIAKLRDFLFRLCIHRRPRPRPPRPRESNDLPALPSHPFVPHPPAPPPTTIIQTQVSASIFPAPDPSQKKALLIGIRDYSKNRTGKKALKGPHKDVKAMYDILINLYKYTPEQITVLLDDDNPNNPQPIKDNILKAIKDLVKDAKPGDRFVFYYAGHSGQKNTDSPDEADGKDERIFSCDRKWIGDNTLNKLLIQPLPPGCILRAVIDTCHSGTLLHLEHCVCNRIYVPWISKGKRGIPTLWNWTVKQNAILTPQRQTPSQTTPRSSYDNFLPSIATTITSLVSGQSSMIHSTRVSRLNMHGLTIVTESLIQSPVETSSPVPPFCDGHHCLTIDVTPALLGSRADVLCLSSSRDEQRTWEDENGRSMTQILVELLREDPNPTLHRMMKDISHEIHDYYLILHPAARQFKKDQHAARQQKVARLADTGSSSVQPSGRGPANPRKPPAPTKSLSLETVNFQDPELSSHFPITPKNMHARFWDL